MALPLPSNKVVEHIRAEFGLDERRIRVAVKLLRDWLKLQPHLPHNCDDARLERWIIRCKNSLERTKSSIDMYYTLKTAVPELMLDRDPYSNWFKNATSIGYVIPLPQLTSNYCRVSIMGLTDSDPEKANMVHVFKALLMFLDLRMCEDYHSADIYVFDMGGITLGHVAKITLPLLKKVQVCLLKGFNTRIKAIHFINVPAYADVVVNLFKSLMKPKLAARIHAYPKGALTLSQKISPKILPVEYGGEYGSITDLWSAWLKKIESYREWFLEQDKYKSDESKRPEKAFDSGDLFGFEGSFRQLNVD